MTNFKIGVVGFGYWGKNQARVFKELGTLEGIYETNQDLIKDHKNEYFFFNTLEAMLKEVDGVIICTPAETHFEIACTALEENVDILVEKPIAMNLSQVKNIIEIEKRKQRIVMVGHQLHFHPAIKKMKELIKDGEIGDIKWIYSNRLNLGKIRPYENVLWSFAPHDISLILEFINDEIKSIDVQATKILNNNIEDTTLTLLNFKNNVKTHIFVSWIHPFKEQRFVIVGSNGSLVFSDTEEINKLKLFKTSISKDGNIEKHALTNIELPSLEPLKEQAKYFLECIENRKINLNDSQHAYNVVSVLEESTKKIKEKSNNG